MKTSSSNDDDDDHDDHDDDSCLKEEAGIRTSSNCYKSVTVELKLQTSINILKLSLSLNSIVFSEPRYERNHSVIIQ